MHEHHPTQRDDLGATHLGHRQLALEPPAHPVINTLGLPPCLLDRVVAVRLVAPVYPELARVKDKLKAATHLKGLVRFLTIFTTILVCGKRALALVQLKQTHKSREAGIQISVHP